MTAPALFGLTERHMLDLLQRRYAKRYGNGDRYVVAEHVRSQAGFFDRGQGCRTADFVAVDTWPSKLAIHGHEVKVSRADWLSELKQPEKAGEFAPYVTHWWAVAAGPFIRLDELPAGWGLMVVAAGGRLRVVRSATRTEAEPLPLSRLAALLRAVARTVVAP